MEGQKRFYEQRLQSLEQTITNQQTRLENLDLDFRKSGDPITSAMNTTIRHNCPS